MDPVCSPTLCRFVFANYTWRDDGSQYTHSFGHMIPSQIPFTALIRGTLPSPLFAATVADIVQVPWWVNHGVRSTSTSARR